MPGIIDALHPPGPQGWTVCGLCRKQALMTLAKLNGTVINIVYCQSCDSPERAW